MQLRFRTWAAVSLVAITTVASAAVVTYTSRAEAQAADDTAVAKTEILVLHATQQPGAGAIDPSIGNLPQLKKPPFNSYNTYRLLDRKAATLKKGTPLEYPMADGRKLELVFLDKTGNRYRLAASINAPKGEAFLKKMEVTASPNEPFFVAGQSWQGGILVLGIAIKDK